MQRRYLDDEYCSTSTDFTDRLKAHKLDNAACLYIRVQFPVPNKYKKEDPKIIEAELIFGSQLKGEHEKDEDNHLEEKEEEKEEKEKKVEEEKKEVKKEKVVEKVEKVEEKKE